MAKENTAGLGVNSYYGERTTTEGSVNSHKTFGSEKQVVLEVTGDNYTIVSGELKAGLKPLKAQVEVQEVFALGGTTPTIAIGTDGSETTNGFAISEAQAEATGIYEITSFNGTWAAQLASATTLGVALGGTTPTITSAGRAKVVIHFADV